jgi:hypothetical protein
MNGWVDFEFSRNGWVLSLRGVGLLGAYRDFPSEDSPRGGLLFRVCLSLCFFSVSQG